MSFDDITQAPPFPVLVDGTVRVPTVYQGFTFDGGQYSYLGNQNSWITTLGLFSSWFPAPASSPVAVWSNGGTWLSLSRNTAFDFVSASLGAMYGACSTGGVSTLTVEGYLGGALTHSDSRSLTCGGFRTEDFGFQNVERLVFSTLSEGGNLLLDDLAFAPATTVPEPASAALVALGVLGLVAVKRRK